MKRFVLFGTYLLILCCLPFCQVFAKDFEVVTPEEAGFSSERLAEIKDRFDALYEDGRIPNYVIALYNANQRFYSAMRGSTKIEGGTPVGLDTIYPLASMTKPVASTAVIRLIQDGYLSLDTKLSKFYPSFKNMFVAPNGSFEENFEEAKREIIIKDLLTHTSGFTYQTFVTGRGDIAKQYDDLKVFRNWETVTLDQHMELLSQIPLVAHPGETFTYSVSTDVLSAVVTKVTGMRLGEYLKMILFEPLKMSNSGFYVDPEKLDNFAEYYRQKPGVDMVSPMTIPTDFEKAHKVESVTSDSEILWKISEGNMFGMPIQTTQATYDSGARGLHGSINDYAKYLAMILNAGEFQGTQVLSREMRDIHLSDLTPQLTSENFRRGFGEGAAFMKFGGGYGIKYLADEGEESEVDYHFWGGAHNTFFWVDVANGHIGVFATNHSPPQYNISDAIEQIVDEAKL